MIRQEHIRKFVCFLQCLFHIFLNFDLNLDFFIFALHFLDIFIRIGSRAFFKSILHQFIDLFFLIFVFYPDYNGCIFFYLGFKDGCLWLQNGGIQSDSHGYCHRCCCRQGNRPVSGSSFFLQFLFWIFCDSFILQCFLEFLDALETQFRSDGQCLHNGTVCVCTDLDAEFSW